ncbi:hypothetical protein CN378_20025 [Bacillus sp. AFS015802]|nr:hypothetical protein CN378_20025 [Bacillus sp. AFS015802]
MFIMWKLYNCEVFHMFFTLIIFLFLSPNTIGFYVVHKGVKIGEFYVEAEVLAGDWHGVSAAEIETKISS